MINASFAICFSRTEPDKLIKAHWEKTFAIGCWLLYLAYRQLLQQQLHSLQYPFISSSFFFSTTDHSDICNIFCYVFREQEEQAPLISKMLCLRLLQGHS